MASFPITTRCYILFPNFLILAFALMGGQGEGKLV